jgi:hypothetical protein
MADYVNQARADAAGNATVIIQHNRSGIVWVVSQIGVRSNPSRPAGSVRILRNGQELMTSSVLPATAGGYPFYQLTSMDVLAVVFANLTSGDTAIVTASYQESLWGQVNTGNVV